MNIYKGLERYAKRQRQKKTLKKIEETFGCLLGPIIMIVLPILLFYCVGFFIAETSLGQIIGKTLSYGYLIFILGATLLFILGVSYIIYKSLDQKIDKAWRLLLSIIITIIGIIILMSIPKSCSVNPDHVHYERY